MMWLDLSRMLVMRRVVGRTLSRRVRSEPLWNGNLEPPLHTILTDREHVIRWAWNTHHRIRDRVIDAHTENPALTIVRLKTHAEVDSWVAGPLRDVME
jgi:hypothetical protein